MANPEVQINAYETPSTTVETTLPDRVGRTPWEWATNILLGLLFGVIIGRLNYGPWNQPVHWVTVVLHFIVTPLNLGF
jgi:hypothetical protein